MTSFNSNELYRAIDSNDLKYLIASITSQETEECDASDDYNCDESDLPISKDDEPDKHPQSDNGFDHDAIMKHIINCAKLHKKTVMAEIFKDINNMVLIGLCLGNIRSDQLARTHPRGAVKIRELAYKYKIRMRSSVRERIQLQSDTLTFVRAISCFPQYASMILYKRAGLSKNGVNSVLATEQLPDAMKHSGFSGLIPKDCDPYLVKAYKFAHAAYMVDFSKLINQRDMRSLKAIALSQLNCANVGVEKSPKSDEFRVGILRKVGLTDSDVFKKIVDVCNNLCKVVGEPEITFETAEKYHIKNNMICFSGKDIKDVDPGEVTEDVTDKLKVASIDDCSTSKN